jgi:hypothetical protein
MNKTILGLGLVLVLAGVGAAQKKVDTNASSTMSSTNSASKNGGNVGLQSGTQIAAQLQSSLDVQKAKVGDQVVLKTTKAIKQNGQVVVDKGARLFGRVTEVQQKTKGSAMSKVGILFDRLEQGGNQLPINAVITSITQAQATTSIDDMGNSDISGGSSTRTSTPSSGGNSGGLLGGVGNAVGGVVNTTTQTVGTVANTAGQTVGNTTRAVGGTLKGIQISQSTDASANGSSTLSLQNGNLHLDKGTTFNLSLNQSVSAGGN